MKVDYDKKDYLINGDFYSYNELVEIVRNVEEYKNHYKMYYDIALEQKKQIKELSYTNQAKFIVEMTTKNEELQSKLDKIEEQCNKEFVSCGYGDLQKIILSIIKGE